MPWSHGHRYIQKKNVEKKKKTVDCYGNKRLTVTWPLWEPVVLRDTFLPLAPALAMSLSSDVHGDQYDTKYVAFEYILQAAFVADKRSGIVAWTISYDIPGVWYIWYGELGWVRLLAVCFLYETNPNPRKLFAVGKNCLLYTSPSPRD